MILFTFNLGSCRPLDPAAPVVDRRVQGEVVPALALEQGINKLIVLADALDDARCGAELRHLAGAQTQHPIVSRAG